MTALEEKFTTLESKLKDLKAENADLRSRIATLEADSNTTGAILTSLPEIQQLVVDNTTALNNWTSRVQEWVDEAERVMMLNYDRYTALDERLTQEETWRNDPEMPTEWQYTRLFAIMGARHAELELHHFDLWNLYKRTTGRTQPIRPRRAVVKDDVILPVIEPTPFPPPEMN